MDDRDWDNPKELLPPNLAALSYALDELEKGVHEITENWSPEIAEYLKATDIAEPAPWCAAFVNACAERAYADREGTSPFEEIHNQALADAYFQWGKKHNVVVPPNEVGPGDLFLLWYDHLDSYPGTGDGQGRYGHVGFVHVPPRDGRYFTTVEGNTGSEGEREGEVVASKRRRVSGKVAFIHWNGKW